MTRSTVVIVLVVAGLSGAVQAADCPAPVKAAIEKAFPKSTISSCKAEKEHGHDQFEVVLAKQDGGKAEVDVAPDGKILVVEEPVALDKVPAAVMKAFAAKYPKAKATGAEKETPTGGKASYELQFETGGKKHEATFTEAGAFVEEE
jgi:putative PepSY-like beta-lactamase-inhibitor